MNQVSCERGLPRPNTMRLSTATQAACYESVRDPNHAGAVAVLRPCFKPRKPFEPRVWLLPVRREAAIWQSDGGSYQFAASEWA